VGYHVYLQHGTSKFGLSVDQLRQIWQPLSYIAINCWSTTSNPFTHRQRR